MFKKALLAAAAVSLSFGAAAGPNEGDWEIEFANLGGGLSSSDGTTTLGADVTAGKFFTLEHELGGKVNFGYHSELDDSLSLGLGGYYEYNMRESAAEANWWYLGGSLDLGDMLSDADQPMWMRLYAGKQYMLSEDVSFNINAGMNMDMGDTELEDVIDVRFGLSVFF